MRSFLKSGYLTRYPNPTYLGIAHVHSRHFLTIPYTASHAEDADWRQIDRTWLGGVNGMTAREEGGGAVLEKMRKWS